MSGAPAQSPGPVARSVQAAPARDEIARVLAPGGLLFARLASNIGLEAQIGPGGRRTVLPDGSERFVVDQPMLRDCSARLGATLIDPIKTTVVQGMRCMTTWVMVKR